MRWPALVLAFAAAAAVAQRPELNEFREVFMWTQLDFAWPDESTRLRALADARYQPENVALWAARAWGDRLFVAAPRLLPGVPATLASIPAAAAAPGAYSPPLRPFPSWEMQAAGNCSALQNVLAIEVDARGRLWAADTGRVHTLAGGGGDARCAAKVVLLEADGGRLLRAVDIPRDLLAPDSLLAAIAVGDGDVAYVSDASPSDPGLLVVGARGGGPAFKVRDPSMRAAPAFATVGQRRTELRHGAFALALSPPPRRLFYAPLGGRDLFSLPVEALSAPGLAVSALVQNHGRLQSAVAAAAADWRGNLFLGLLEQDAVARWDGRGPPAQAPLLTRDPERLQWVSSLAVAADRHLWVVSNRLQNFLAGTVDQQSPNYRVIRAFVDAKSSLYADPAWATAPSSNSTLVTVTAPSLSSTAPTAAPADSAAPAAALAALLSSLLPPLLALLA